MDDRLLREMIRREDWVAQNHMGLYLSIASFAPWGEAGGEREPGLGWGDRARD
jgi:hypothetical protein